MIEAVLCPPDTTQRSKPAIAAAVGLWVLGAGAGVLVAMRPRRVEVRGASMEPTLAAGDRLVVLAGVAPRPGAVVAVHDPRQPEGELLVKRVAAISPAGLDVRGDNPERSTDSRIFGAVPYALVEGTVVWRYGPPERAGRIDRGPAAASSSIGTAMPQGRSIEQTTHGALLPLRPAANPPDPELEGRATDIDQWGRSAKARALIARLYGPLYKHWFRAEWEGLEKIPAAGGALLVANHAGAIPVDAPLIMHGIEQELDRPVYGLADYFFREFPGVGTAWARGGGVTAHPDNAYRLLHDEGQLALVFPEGTKATGKVYSQRYKLRRFGRGGFVDIAMRAGVPIVPIVVIGSEEAMPMLAKSATLARLLGVPYVPLTANMLLLGPLGLLGYFPAKIRFRVLDPITFDVPPDQDRYPRNQVFDEAEKIRQAMQAEIYEMLRQRRSVWFG